MEINITKMFECKDPIVATEKSVGMDLCVPKFTQQFKVAICNEQLNPGGYQIFEIERLGCKKKEIIATQETFSKLQSLAEKIEATQFKDHLTDDYNTIFKWEVLAYFCEGKMYINFPITIPSGICIDCPKDIFFDVRGKSSSFKNGYKVIYGTGDEDYTYGIGVTIEPNIRKRFEDFSDTLYEPISFEEDQKFAQIVLMRRALETTKISVLKPEEFSSLETVMAKRGMRVGGFGSTGKK